MDAPVERDTRQKRAIRDVFANEPRPLSTDEVHAAAQEIISGLGKATVYRAIRTMLDDGSITAVDVPGKGVVYELAGKAHHHHFSCTSCLRVYELDGCEAELSVRLPRGFRATGHEVTVSGVCAACRLPKVAKPAPAVKRARATR